MYRIVNDKISNGMYRQPSQCHNILVMVMDQGLIKVEGFSLGVYTLRQEG